MHYVIGSGPAGVACAAGLLGKGLEVTMMDAGLELEEPRQRAVESLQAIAPSEWRGERGGFLRDGMHAGSAGVPLKMAYGSDFAYRTLVGTADPVQRGASMAASYAQGGLSNVWGAAVLPYRQSDLTGWPFAVERLAKHYRAVFEFMPLAGRRDELEEQFPLYAEQYETLETSRQARAMLCDLEAHRESLRGRGIRFGSARIAVAAHRDGRDCVRCGLCMYGCPHRLIYSSADTLRDLQQQERFHYLPGLQVTRVSEGAGRVRILTQPAVPIDRANPAGEGANLNGPATAFEGERVYLACGVLATTTLLLRSLERYDSPAWAADSKYFLLPILRFRGTAGVRAEALHTLAQIFLEIDDPAISPYTIHLQTYTYNDLFEQALRSSLGWLAPAASGNALISRLLLLQGYLHSADSPRIRMELRRKPSGEEEMQVAGETPTAGDKIVRAVIGKLARSYKGMGALPLSPLLRLSAPGRGFHSGGSFPMREHPQDGEADVFGRPSGLTRIHAVDSSIFPSIPATTITLSAMANAHRIADELELYA